MTNINNRFLFLQVEIVHAASVVFTIVILHLPLCFFLLLLPIILSLAAWHVPFWRDIAISHVLTRTNRRPLVRVSARPTHRASRWQVSVV